MEKKTNITNSAFQSQFLPLLQRAETEIKKLIQFYALKLKSKTELRNKIKGIIKAVAKRLPFSLYEREKYIYGLYNTSEIMIRDFYDEVVARYLAVIAILTLLGKKPKVDNPLELIQYQTKHPTELKPADGKFIRELWSKQKGQPYIVDYPKLVEEKQKQLAKTQTTSSEADGKKPISIWQKAELDLRHEHQMDMINELVGKGVRYAYTSSHPDCSKRCEKWQGKLFDLVADSSELSGHRMKKKLDGKTVYCFKEVISKKDKYGYTNNIIVGFNCRHRLIAYNGQLPPEEYSKEEVEEYRKINAMLREMERKIRFYLQQAELYNGTNKKLADFYRKKAKQLIEEYKALADKYGFVWYDYRIKI